MSDYYKQDINILNISTKTKNSLRYYGIKTIQDLDDADLMNNVKFSYFSFNLRRKILDSVKQMKRELLLLEHLTEKSHPKSAKRH